MSYKVKEDIDDSDTEQWKFSQTIQWIEVDQTELFIKLIFPMF